jgi:hypothetical protein
MFRPGMFLRNLSNCLDLLDGLGVLRLLSGFPMGPRMTPSGYDGFRLKFVDTAW